MPATENSTFTPVKFDEWKLESNLKTELILNLQPALIVAINLAFNCSICLPTLGLFFFFLAFACAYKTILGAHFIPLTSKLFGRYEKCTENHSSLDFEWHFPLCKKWKVVINIYTMKTLFKVSVAFHLAV